MIFMLLKLSLYTDIYPFISYALRFGKAMYETLPSTLLSLDPYSNILHIYGCKRRGHFEAKLS